jgi:putative ABC transport system permease protein
MISIALVVAAGIMSVVTMRGGYESLILAQANYYSASRFADVWSGLERAPRHLEEDIRAIPGVAAAETRVTLLAALDLPDLDLPGLGRFVSMPDRERPRLNDVHIVHGRYLAAGRRDEVIVSDNFAVARGISPGDTISAVINGTAWDFSVVGVAVSPEHTYAVPPGALYPEDERYGVLWLSYDVLAPAFGLDGAFNEVMLSLTDDACLAAVVVRLERLRERCGG